MDVAVIASLLYPTGYSEAAREHAKALAVAGVRVGGVLYQAPHPLLHRELITDDHQVNEMIARGKDMNPDAVIQHLTPDAFMRMDKPTIGFAVWELSGLPLGWADRINATCDGLMTASEFSAQHFRDGGVTVPIWAVPHPIDLDRFSPDQKPAPALAKIRDRYDTIFLIVAQWMPRKGVEDALIAYLTEFRPEDRTLLVMQVWRNTHAPSEQRVVQEMIGHIRQGLNFAPQPDVMLLGGRLDRGDVGGVYAGVDVHVSSSRGESFCLPVFEAAATGKPTIATAWGGMWNYLDSRSAFPVEYMMEPAHGVGGVWKHYNGTQWWARASIKSLREQMRYAHENKEDAKQRGLRAMDVVMEKMTHPVVGRQMREILKEVISIAKTPSTSEVPA